MNTLTTSQQFEKSLTDVSDSEYRRLRTNFDNFIESTPLLKHFIECDENGEPIKEPEKKDFLKFIGTNDKGRKMHLINKKGYESALYEFQQAQKQVLFEAEIENMPNRNSYVKCNEIIIFYKDVDMDNKWSLSRKFQSYSDLTKCQLQTNNNFKELIYGK